MKSIVLGGAIACLLLSSLAFAAPSPQGTAFTYQGNLRQNGTPISGSVDMVFELFDAATGGNPVGPALAFSAGNGNPVSVQDGVFSVALDFGAPAFNTLVSEERYLKVTINGTVLVPRNKIQNAPYALQSRAAEVAYTVSNAAIGTAQIDPSQVQRRVGGVCAAGTSIQTIAQNGTVTCQAGGSGTVTSVAAGTGLTGGPIVGSGTLAIANAGVGLAQIDTAAVQARVTGTCTAAQKLLGVDAAGTVVCGPDAVGGVGSVTSVSAGTGLSGGPITSTGSLAIANAGVGLAQIDTAQVQARVTGSCALGEYVRGINADGSLVCAAVPGVQRMTAVVTTNNVGQFPRTAIGSDGLPVLTYLNITGQATWIAHCGNPACTASTLTYIGASGNTYSAVAIGTDGLPVVAYQDQAFSALRFAHCTSVACPTVTTVPVDPGAGSGAGVFAAIAIGADGLPIASYYESGTADLKFVHCGNITCSNSNLITTIDAAGNVGWDTSVAVGVDGLPIISYYDFTNGNLKVAHCINAACTGATLITPLDTAGDVGRYTSLAIGTDGLPVVSYFDGTNGDLKVAHCANAACTGAAFATLDTAGFVGAGSSMQIGADGFPVISYSDGTNGDLKVHHCSDVTCSAPGVTTTVDAIGLVGAFPSLAIAPDGLPVISYYDETNQDLKVLKCNNRFCQ